jgi:hypothetical protein
VQTRTDTEDVFMHIRAHSFSSMMGRFGVLCLVVGLMPGLSAHAAVPSPVKIAVFDFELEDVSAAGALSAGDSAADLARMQAVTGEARKVLAQSGRYSLVDTHDVDAQAVKDRALRSCDGCDAGIALKLGADQSLIGVVRRVAKTEYYVSFIITDAQTGKVVNQQAAFFTGADDAWPSGVRLLLKHGVLAD